MEHENTRTTFMGDSGRIYKSNINNIRTGITSKFTSDNIYKSYRHIPMFDFDKYNLQKLINQFKHFKMRHKPRLSNIYIFKTSSHKLSAICFSPITWIKYKGLLFSLDVDPNFRYYTVKRKEATLRITPKIEKRNSNLKLIYTIKSPHNNLEIRSLRESIFKLIGLENESERIGFN